MLVYLGLAEHLRVPWLVWENVPGVLSSNGGRDFGTFLGALGQLGYRWSYRVLDAQYFGVPQRRRRVFVIASLGDRPHPAKVLFESESLRGDSAKSSQARKGSPRGARQGAESGGRPGPFWNGADVAEALTRTSDDQRMPDKGRMQMVVQPYRMTAFGQYADDDSASTCKQRDHKDATDLVVTATGSVTHALGTQTGGIGGGVGGILSSQPTMQVRRLLPVECERLQGFPDDHTLIPWKKKPASECPDGPRYKAMGNSMAVPVMRFIGTRLDALVRGDL